MIDSTTNLMTGKIRVFVSYDRLNDKDLHETLAKQAASSMSGFEIAESSRQRLPHNSGSPELRRSIREAEQVIVICGEHANRSEQMATELAIAKEEKRPCLLLWGRRDPMCTKPESADATDQMYSWTEDNLVAQIQNLRRIARADALAAERARLKAEARQA